MNIVIESNCILTIKLTFKMGYEQMITAILNYFTPDYKSGDEITSWYEGFVFHKIIYQYFYFNHYDIGGNSHCFEIQEEDEDKKVCFKTLIENFEKFLDMQSK